MLGCGGKKSAQQPEPQLTAPLPTAGLAGQRVALIPLALVGAEDTLHWDALIADRRNTLDKSDSIISTLLAARAPEVTWVVPTELRRIARRAPGIVTDPDQMGTPFLRGERIVDVPDPLRYQLRTARRTNSILSTASKRLLDIGGEFGIRPAARNLALFDTLCAETGS